MKPASLNYTYTGYLHNVHYCKETIDEQDIYRMLNQFSQLSGQLNNLLPTFFAIDYTTKKYLYISNGIQLLSGYHPKAILEGGLDMLINHVMEENFFHVFNAKIFPITTQFLQNTPQAEHHQYIFSFNNRIKCSDGRHIDWVQRSTFITSSETGLPIYGFGMVIKMGIVNKYIPLEHTIEKIENKNGIATNKIVEYNSFYPYEEKALLTKQERNILKWMVDGLSSKMIADKLKISENTISNHRQNMLRKTNTRNVAQLVAFAINTRII
ncbi:MAG TPA: helix-turn-helix transcriptional regulator [Ferruginibacter sp.]|jgi:DNA-binding CsgD family transcriptional regulator|nr:helix-turn-helix transcriptional regulator [Ferruginibacter sp.]